MDNFIELQLSSLISEIFSSPSSYIKSNKYTDAQKKVIPRNYDKLLAASVKENLITAKDKNVLTFCHDVRNNLYHKGGDEKLLVEVAMRSLHEIICRHQPKWKSGRSMVVYSFSKKDLKKSNFDFSLNCNTTDDRLAFLRTSFVLNSRTKSVSFTLSKFLLEKLNYVRYAFSYLSKNYPQLHPYTKDWSFQDYLSTFSPFVENSGSTNTYKNKGGQEGPNGNFNTLNLEYNEMRLDSLEKIFLAMRALPTEDAVERFWSLKNEIRGMYVAFSYGMRELEDEIHNEIRRIKGG